MTTAEKKIARRKLGLLELAQDLQNVSSLWRHGCEPGGLFYDFK